MDVTGISGASSALSGASVGYGVSVEVLDMAQNVMEDTMGQLLDTMDSIITGLGQSFDMSV